MSINHDLSYYPTWLVLKQDHCKESDILFLDLGNRLEAFDSDAEILRELGFEISRITPRGESGFFISTCRIYNKDLNVLHKIIDAKYSIGIAKRCQ